jgi:hypothetical protein
LMRRTLLQFIDTSICQLICAFILRMAAVSLHPVPTHLMALIFGVKRLPKVDIFYRLAPSGLPSPLLPGIKPVGNAASYVDGICGEIDAARARQCLESADGCLQFHAIIGGIEFTTEQLQLNIPVAQEGAPSAGPRIAATGTIGKYFNYLQAATFPVSEGIFRCE